jgi:small subunit ribosomal protein S2
MADSILEGKSNPAGDVQRAMAEGSDEFVEVKEGASA